MKDRQEAGSASRLALLGGSPAFEAALHVGRPNIGDRARFARRVDVMLDRRWLTNNGAYVRELEARIARLLEVQHCIAVCNGTTALQIMAKACGLGGEIIMPSFTFVATAHALEWQGVTPVFCDIDPATHNIDPAKVEELITSETSAILGVHVWGRACDVEALARVALRHGLCLCFDAAHAFACSTAGRMVGGQGLAEAFSFHATKFFNTFEGGAITTDDDELAEIVWSLHNCGRVRQGAWYQHELLGWNARITAFQAALLLAQFERLPSHLVKREENATYLSHRLSEIPGIRPLARDPRVTTHAWHLYIFRYDPTAFRGMPREDFLKALRAEGVPCAPGYVPLHHAPAVKKETTRLMHELGLSASPTAEAAPVHMPVSEKAGYQEGVWLTQSMLLGDKADMDDIAEAVAKIHQARGA
jgi:dTDP-4-amino-4,6-dideoxygalactose transaminase